MKSHVYGCVRASLFPESRLEELRGIFKYSNLPNWKFKRKEFIDDIIGVEYIGFEEKELNEDMKKVIIELNIIIFNSSDSFCDWFNEHGNLDIDWPLG